MSRDTPASSPAISEAEALPPDPTVCGWHFLTDGKTDHRMWWEAFAHGNEPNMGAWIPEDHYGPWRAGLDKGGEAAEIAAMAVETREASQIAEEGFRYVGPAEPSLSV